MIMTYHVMFSKDSEEARTALVYDVHGSMIHRNNIMGYTGNNYDCALNSMNARTTYITVFSWIEIKTQDVTQWHDEK